jgi:(S)-ureidoglycine aminohydrolase
LGGIENAKWVAHITPAMGAQFSQSTVTLATNGSLVFPEANSTEDSEHVIYVWKGSASLTWKAAGKKTDQLTAGSYVYLPPGTHAGFVGKESGATLIWFEKLYEPSRAKISAQKPEPIVGHAKDVIGQPFLGNPKALLQTLLPDNPSFDMAVNIFTYQPGAGLPFVETHVMEHGLLMLSGRGIYRLEDEWYPVVAGDIIWMAPYCPQWFAALGDEPASYLYYKDINRFLL